MGDSISQGTIEEFVKCKYRIALTELLEPGEFVKADEVIARIETDKVTVDIAAPKAGVIKEYFAAEGDEVDVGADFYTLDTDAKAGDATPAAASTPEPAATPKAEEAPKAVSVTFEFEPLSASSNFKL